MADREEKDRIYYAACLNAWIETNLEKDKQLLTLSSLGIGLLITLHQSLGSWIEFAPWLFAALFFLLSIATALFILHFNGKLLEAEIKENKEGSKSMKNTLRLADNLLPAFFIIATLCTLILAVVKAYAHIQI